MLVPRSASEFCFDEKEPFSFLTSFACACVRVCIDYGNQQWWVGELIGEVTSIEQNASSGGSEVPTTTGAGADVMIPFGLSSKWRLRYQKYGSFAAEERTVVFLQPHLLVDLEDQQLLEWRKYGEPYEPMDQVRSKNQKAKVK